MNECMKVYKIGKQKEWHCANEPFNDMVFEWEHIKQARQDMQRQTREETGHAETDTGRDRTCRDRHRKRQDMQRKTQEETEHADGDTNT